jgi:hypothetical protein
LTQNQNQRTADPGLFFSSLKELTVFMKEPEKNWLFYIPQLAALCFENHDNMTLTNDIITAGVYLFLIITQH